MNSNIMAPKLKLKLNLKLSKRDHTQIIAINLCFTSAFGRGVETVKIVIVKFSQPALGSVSTFPMP